MTSMDTPIRRRRSRLVRLALTLVGLAVVGYGASRLDLHEVASSIRNIDPVFGILAALVMLGAKVGCKVVRSQILLTDASRRIDREPPTWAVTARLLAASHAAGQLAWGPLGFTVRTIALRDGGMPLAAVARVHVAERLAEAFGIAVIVVAALVMSPGAILASWFGRVVVVALAAIPLALAVSSRLRAKVRDSGPALGRATAWAFASSVADICVLLLAARGIHVPLDVPTAIFAFLAINGACALPVTPAQLGVQESAIVVALATAGIAAPQALAVAIAYRVAHVVPLALVGVPALIATWTRRSPAARM